MLLCQGLPPVELKGGEKWPLFSVSLSRKVHLYIQVSIFLIDVVIPDWPMDQEDKTTHLDHPFSNFGQSVGIKCSLFYLSFERAISLLWIKWFIILDCCFSMWKKFVQLHLIVFNNIQFSSPPPPQKKKINHLVTSAKVFVCTSYAFQRRQILFYFFLYLTTELKMYYHLSYSISKQDAFNIVDPSSMQDACHT